MCCSDKTSCCRHGYTCGTGKMCNPNSGNGRLIPMAQKQAVQPIQVKLRSSSILCPDKQGTCPHNSTCCILMSGTYGCCPYPKVSGRLVTYLFLWHGFYWLACISKCEYEMTKVLGRPAGWQGYQTFTASCLSYTKTLVPICRFRTITLFLMVPPFFNPGKDS